jgi:protein-S-isoprenylcysteine O-methyltransferase Ste14
MLGKLDPLPPTLQPRASALPPSAVEQSTSLVALVSLVSAAASLKMIELPADRTVFALWVLVSAVAISCLALETAKAPLWPMHGAVSDRQRRNRVAVKLVGLAGIYALLALAYWVLPIYRREFQHFFIFIRPAIPIILLTAPFYVWLTDRAMKEPVDGCFMTGLALMGRWDDVSWKLVRSYAAGWLVKGFFLPFMLEAAFQDVQWFLATDLKSQLMESRYGWYDLTFRMLYGVDVVWGSTGYLMTLRLFHTHVRSTEHTLDGWLVCLICYAPFWGVIYGNYVNYEDGYYWAYWLSDQTVLRILWGAAILALTVIYCWATISFGARFSNLTHRGILTNGPYRWSKHPAYIAKNLSWWLISMPFLSADGPAEAVRLSLLLLGVNAIYYWRAKTEERHLSADPVYRQYAEWVGTCGLLPMLKAQVIRCGRVIRARNRPF